MGFQHFPLFGKVQFVLCSTLGLMFGPSTAVFCGMLEYSHFDLFIDLVDRAVKYLSRNVDPGNLPCIKIPLPLLNPHY